MGEECQLDLCDLNVLAVSHILISTFDNYAEENHEKDVTTYDCKFAYCIVRFVFSTRVKKRI